MSLAIYYDGGCPFCSRYVHLLRLREAVGTVDLVNLREAPDARRRLEREGHDLDQAMVVEMDDGRRVGGADAVQTLALLSTPSNGLNRIMNHVLASPTWSRMLYPLLRSGRWLTLFVMGREGIAAADPGAQARATVFGLFFALFSIFHFFNYMLEYERFPPSIDQALLLVAAVILLMRPQSARALCLLMLASTISMIAQAPVQSNHTMVRTALLLGYWIAFAWSMARGSRWDAVFTRFAPAGQGALLVMYFFGIFHKINSGFLNPETSCAVALWREMPVPLSLIDGPAMHMLAIYGTFAVEGAMIVMLLHPRLRHIGIACGIGFHLLLAMSSYAMYVSFTTLAISLHVLFLGGPAARRILDAPAMRFLRARSRDPLYWGAGLCLLGILFVAAANKEYTIATLAILPIVLPFCVIVLRHGHAGGAQAVRDDGRRDGAPLAIGAVVTILFFLNGALPYAGLKTAQTIAMFANLRLEAGVSNHLVFPYPPGPFGYLEDVAIIADPGGDPQLSHFKEQGYAMVYYDLLAHLVANPELTIGFTRGDIRYRGVGATDVQNDIASILHPAWVRKWFHFQPVMLDQPERCTI